jgi:hypothetical protein
MRVSQGRPKPVETISKGVSRGWPTKPAVLRNGKYISSTLSPSSKIQPLTVVSVTTATDTAMLRVVMAAVEGSSLFEYHQD